MKRVAKIYGMNVKADKTKLSIEGDHIDILLRHFREYLPNIVFLDESAEEYIKRSTRIAKDKTFGEIGERCLPILEKEVLKLLKD